MGAEVGLEPYQLMAQYLEFEDQDDEMDDFYDDVEDEEVDGDTLDRAAVSAIKSGTSVLPDVEAAERLVDQVAATMVSVATGGPEIKKGRRWLSARIQGARGRAQAARGQKSEPVSRTLALVLQVE